MYVYKSLDDILILRWAVVVTTYQKLKLINSKAIMRTWFDKQHYWMRKMVEGLEEYNFSDGDPITTRVKLEYIDGRHLKKTSHQIFLRT